MADIKKGSICRSLAGHDKGIYYIIVETGNVIKVSDGKYRPLSNPKVKNLKHLEIVDYEEMILTGMFKKSEVEEERMKWKTVEDDNVMESNETVNVLNRNIRGSKSFIIRMKPMEFKTFQVTIN